jgi:hypothetical protein
MSTFAQRLCVVELLTWAEREGITLPLPAERIVELEHQGFVVDLVTGEVLEDINPDAPITLQPNTPANAGDWN